MGLPLLFLEGELFVIRCGRLLCLDKNRVTFVHSFALKLYREQANQVNGFLCGVNTGDRCGACVRDCPALAPMPYTLIFIVKTVIIINVIRGIF
jgi:ferredoxin